MKKVLLLSTAFVIFIHGSTSLAALPSFQGLGDLPDKPGEPNGVFFSEAYGISSDGTVVVGASQSVAPNTQWDPEGTEAFIWTASGGMVGLGDLEGGYFASQAKAVSADGSVVVGYGKAESSGFEAFRWTQSGGMISLGDLAPGEPEGSHANGVSSDGSVVVGIATPEDREAFRWTESGGMVGLGHLPTDPDDDYLHSRANGVSGDGSIVVGTDTSTDDGYRAFRWTADTNDMTPLIAASYDTYAKGVSDDGQVVVGSYFTGNQSIPFCWKTTDSGIFGFGFGEIPGHTTKHSTAYAASADGSIIMGGNNAGIGNYQDDEAFVWDSINGIRNLQDVLEGECGLDLSGWTLTAARDVSADGLTIAGIGINPDGYTEAWIATLPEPILGDLTCDCKVDLEDIAKLSTQWQSGYVMDTLLDIANNWLYGTSP